MTLAKNYQPYGTEASSVGNGLSSYGFTGEMTDPTGLIYLRARYYESLTGRFTTRDTFEGSINNPPTLNRYSYSLNNPVLYTDPSGNCPIPVICQVLIGGAGNLCRKLLCAYTNPLWIGSGFDDPKDWNAVELGVSLYNSYGAGMSFSQFADGLTSRREKLARPSIVPELQWTNPNGGWPYSVGRFNGSREMEFEPVVLKLLNQ